MNITLAFKTVLSDAGIDPTLIKRDYLPDSPDKVIVISDTGGVTPDANDTAIAKKQIKTVQVYVRGKDHDEATGLCDQIRTALVGRVNVQQGDLRLANILMISEFQSIGKDDVGRWEFTANFSTLAIDEAA